MTLKTEKLIFIIGHFRKFSPWTVQPKQKNLEKFTLVTLKNTTVEKSMTEVFKSVVFEKYELGYQHISVLTALLSPFVILGLQFRNREQNSSYLEATSLSQLKMQRSEFRWENEASGAEEIRIWILRQVKTNRSFFHFSISKILLQGWKTNKFHLKVPLEVESSTLRFWRQKIGP